MKIRTCFVLCNYLLAALALSVLALSEIFPLPVNLVFLAALGFCGFLESKKIIPLTAPKRLPLWKSGFVFLPFVLYFFDFQVLDLLVTFLILVLFTRIIYKTELNDYLYGYLIAIVCLLVGAIYIADFIFGVLFLSFYMVLCWALIFYNLMVERVGSNCPPESFKRIGATISIFKLNKAILNILRRRNSIPFCRFIHNDTTIYNRLEFCFTIVFIHSIQGKLFRLRARGRAYVRCVRS